MEEQGSEKGVRWKSKDQREESDGRVRIGWRSQMEEQGSEGGVRRKSKDRREE